MENSRITVEIFGNSYTIQGDASADYIKELADFVDKKMNDVSSGLSSANPTQVAILAALNIADEYFQLGKSSSNIECAIENKAQNLIAMLDEGLIGDVFRV